MKRFIVRYKAQLYGNTQSTYHDKDFDFYNEALEWIESGYKVDSYKMNGFIKSVDKNVYLRSEVVIDESILRDLKIDSILENM